MTEHAKMVRRAAVPTPPKVIDWIAKANSLRPLIEAEAATIDAQGRLTEPVIAGLRQAGMFRMLVPWELGGYQLDPPSFVATVEALAHADASTAWVVSQCTICTMAMAYLAHDVGMEIVGNDSDAILAWGAMPSGRADRTDGGWTISGHWFFASGSRHATWMGGRCPLYQSDGTPILAADGTPAVRMFLFPRSSANVVDSWDVIGLRGTGSDSYSVQNLFVSDGFEFDVNVQAGHPGVLYRIVNRHLFGPGVAAVGLGLSRAMLDHFIKAARDPKKKLAESSAIQSELGRMESRWRASRAFLYASLNAMWSDIVEGKAESVEHQIDLRSASTHAIRESFEIAEFAYHEAGAASVLAAQPYERRIRDAHAMLQHGQSKRSNMETVGKHLLGIDTGPLIL